MSEVVLLALGLAMDAFAVSIALGAKPAVSLRQLAYYAGGYFGFFQGVMPLIGDQVGRQSVNYMAEVTPIIAFIILLFIGVKMIYESISQDTDQEQIKRISHRIMLTLAIATSIDAMAAGFTFAVLEFKVLHACLIIGAITFFMSFVGVYIGSKGFLWLEKKAEFIGGCILILIGFKLILF
jgi:putative Mn2+ efflux pump MntP